MGNELLDELEPLGAEPRVEVGQPCHVPTGPAEACDEPGPDGVSDAHEDDGDGVRRLLRSDGPACTLRNDRVDVETDQLRNEVGKELGPLRVTVFEESVLPLDVTQVMQRLPEDF